MSKADGGGFEEEKTPLLMGAEEGLGGDELGDVGIGGFFFVGWVFRGGVMRGDLEMEMRG